jgi:serine/threonine protein kinase/tetratricopeptide (TPR) repeat protein
MEEAQAMQSATTAVIQNRYILERQLGTGSMGAVFAARDRLTGKQVALKRVFHRFPDQALPLALKLAVTNEFEVLASLRHPNIVNVIDYGIDGTGMPFFTMNYLEGAENFRAAARQRPLREQVLLLLQVVDALRYLRRRGIVHRDLKPDNLLVVNGIVHLLDFGLAVARTIAEDDDARISGTIAYMAPEVLSGEAPSFASDQYALGVMAYEIFAGRPMISGSGGVQQMIYRALNQPVNLGPLALALDGGAPVDMPDAPRREDAEESATMVLSPQEVQSALSWIGETSLYPSEGQLLHPLVPIIGRMLLRDPAARYADAEEITADLCAAIGEAPMESAVSRDSFLQAARFVGRDREFQRLSDALEEALAGRGGLWLVGGESGVGKSRLLNEIRHQAMVKGMLVLTGEAVRGGGEPFQMWRGAVRRLLLQVPFDPSDAASLQLYIPDLARMLSLDPDALSYGEVTEPLSVIIRRLFERCRQPVLVLLEDLHWAGQESLEVLDAVCALAGTRPLLIIGNFRSDEAPGLLTRFPSAKPLRLDRLSSSATEELARSMLGRAARPELVRALQRQTEGNVFFLVETVRALADEAGALERIAALDVPEHLITRDMRQIIERRLAQVPERYAVLLEAAAVAGRVIDRPLLASIGQEISIEDWLTATINASVIEFQNERWRFTHDKLREHILDGLQPARLRELHQRVAEALEQLYPPEERAAALVRHWRGAGNTAREMKYLRIAGMRAEQLGAYEEARLLYERGLQLAETPEQVTEYEMLLGGHYEFVSQYDEALLHLNRAIDTARRPGFEPLLADVVDRMAWVHIRFGQTDAALEMAQQVMALARSLQDEQRMMGAYMLIGIVRHMRGEMQAAYELLMEGLPYAEALDDSYALASYLNALGATQEGVGLDDTAIQTLTRASALAQELGNLAALGNIEGNLGRMHYNRQRYSEAAEHFLTARVAFQRVNNGYGEALAENFLAFISLKQGDPEPARTSLRQSLEICLRIGALSVGLLGLCAAAELHRLGGRERRAAQLLGLIRGHELAREDADIQRESTYTLQRLTLPSPDALMASGRRLELNEVIRDEQAAL